MGKRRRDEEGGMDDGSQPSAKRQETQKDDGLSAAARRQARSERKSKKPKSKSQSDKKLKQEDSAVAKDSLAEGDDFVSIAPPDAEDTKAAINRPSKKSKKAAKDSSTREGEKSSESASKKPKESVRFICFVGNLPYSCTLEQVKHHFRKIEPTSVRLSTDKVTGKPKGFAFIEFDDYSKMKTCLKVYHHSIFDPERTAKLPESAFDEHGLAKEMPEPNGRRPTGRKINVELTAGGGGQGAGRKQKITQKNEKLWEERERRKKADMKQQRAKDKKNKDTSEANATAIGADAVHPDRLRLHRE